MYGRIMRGKVASCGSVTSCVGEAAWVCKTMSRIIDCVEVLVEMYKGNEEYTHALQCASSKAYGFFEGGDVEELRDEVVTLVNVLPNSEELESLVRAVVEAWAM